MIANAIPPLAIWLALGFLMLPLLVFCLYVICHEVASREAERQTRRLSSAGKGSLLVMLFIGFSIAAPMTIGFMISLRDGFLATLFLGFIW